MYVRGRDLTAEFLRNTQNKDMVTVSVYVATYDRDLLTETAQALRIDE